MSDSESPKVGTVGWIDLTVDDAEGVQRFYREVVGWGVEPFDMGGYEDWAMTPPGGGPPAAGICHARGPNTDVPPQWIIYIVVDDLEAAVARARDRGGEVVTGPRSAGGGTMCVLRDPAGAVFALYQGG